MKKERNRVDQKIVHFSNEFQKMQVEFSERDKVIDQLKNSEKSRLQIEDMKAKEKLLFFK